ncbi:nitroreductase family protein [Anabaena cylindrica FACHB-243]|uniref:Nitroreductase n=1 Tax=Anabaena cylindrica (strain ATCC 27899 / PCC 7122) TaxID=272123 RepID=K9ZHJ8_ANACC|nr:MULTISPECIES: nitroreductase family protein [Anabaena]AFZ58219.1 nitroreductase [Anabaena cylindrica PCC 7122]MBD2419867.1 nitroreductase family protein [Anabaena cylindrica FACHB-243]MBY5280993.1 nitroreductase family protein [Anabaena sp. CCAP 1446/1C]MBY5307356.1 nitroreductase family protein [Anabaena sp. CCAP 1446/1C]MCM2407934.1 nitroreductase family protein [Anabaena sp. CCAP 1446/1C]
MEKLANPQYPIHQLLQQRWSPLAFAEKQIEAETLYSLLEAARWSASSYNEQPWYFIVATQENPEEFSKLLSCLVEPNQVWAKNVPVLMISVAKLNFEKNGQPNRHAFYDLGGAVCSLVIQATSLGLFVHQMAGFDASKAQDLYSIPEGYEAVSAIAIGYPGDPQTLPEQYQQREFAPRQRKPQQEFVFTNTWGKN